MNVPLLDYIVYFDGDWKEVHLNPTKKQELYEYLCEGVTERIVKVKPLRLIAKRKSVIEVRLLLRKDSGNPTEKTVFVPVHYFKSCCLLGKFKTIAAPIIITTNGVILSLLTIKSKFGEKAYKWARRSENIELLMGVESATVEELGELIAMFMIME